MTTPLRPVVCVVDDDPGIRESLRFLFEEAEYEVREARDGSEALELLRADPRPCVMLLDRMMARTNGLQTLQRLVEEPERIQRRTAVLFMTARNDPPAPEAASFIQRHTFALVPKPFDLDALLALVARAAAHVAAADVRG